MYRVPGGEFRAAKRTQDGEAFRGYLRRRTRPEHDAAEAVFAAFIDDPADRMAWFLAAQHAALDGLLRSLDPTGQPASAPILEEALDLLERDLSDYGHSPVAATPVAGLDALAVDYIVLGSRHGVAALRSMLGKTVAVRELPRYFGGGTSSDLWRSHCRTLDTVPVGSPRADRILEDVRRGFALFTTAARLQHACYGD